MQEEPMATRAGGPETTVDPNIAAAEREPVGETRIQEEPMATRAGGPETAVNPNVVAADNPANLIQQHAAGAAIVLSGGGAKGDFEVGAVRCLYNNGIRPKILCGTSVGSVNALKLAEGEDTPASGTAPAGHVRGLAGLEKIWESLSTDPDMWALEPGVAAVFSTLSNLSSEAAGIQAQASEVGTASIGGVIASLFGAPGFFAFAPQLSDLNSLQNSATTILANLATTLTDADNILGLANYDPLEKLMRNPASLFLPYQEGSGIMLRLAMVALEDGALRYVNEANRMLERDGQLTPIPPPLTAAEIAALKAEAAKLTAEIAKWPHHTVGSVAQNRGPGPGGTAITDVPDNPAGLASLMQQLAATNGKLGELQFDLIRAAIASSSLPVICRPTTMQDGRTYVDGGIRTLAPIQAAIDAGASNVYAVAAGSTKFDTSTLSTIIGGTPLPLLGIALRVGEAILPDEVGRRDLFPDNPWPVPVVIIQPDPTLDDIHDGLTIEPGLIRIRMAYGFMRAYDTLRAVERFSANYYLAATRQNSVAGKTMDIVLLRKQIWDLEFPANGRQFVLSESSLPPAPYTVKNLPAPVQSAHDQVKTLKGQLKTLLDARVAYYTDAANNINGSVSLPSDYLQWSTEWEKHSWTPSVTL
jgi:NTE family protein